MAGFMARFFASNILLAFMVGILLLARRLFKSVLRGRMQYRLWLLLPLLLAVPFLPFRPHSVFHFLSYLTKWGASLSPKITGFAEHMPSPDSPGITGGIRDLALSVNGRASSPLWLFLWYIWIGGCLAGLWFLVKSALRLRALERAALPLQNQKIRILYKKCLKELGISRNIPVYSTPFLKSPVIVGLFRPRIYLPTHLISDAASFRACEGGSGADRSIRHMLLHELQHYRHRDALANHLMNLARILYWFNPFVRLALKEMRNDREIACDASVLEILKEPERAAYAATLLSLAGKFSLHPFAAGISGSARQMERRILHIVSYQSPSPEGRWKGFAAYALTALLLLGLAPGLSTYAAKTDAYAWDAPPETVAIKDLSPYFQGYEGAFVLYEPESGSWSVYNPGQALKRVSPNSTYKIYDALLGLEKGVITPENSDLKWDGTTYPFDAWNKDQNLRSALFSSVNWYFQELDARLGSSAIRRYLKEIRYGNQNPGGGLSSYWLQSSLKISPVEQVELLVNLYRNSFGFAPENIAAVQDSICIFQEGDEALYGKTGTGRVDGRDINGWFVGYATGSGRTLFFAVNIQGEDGANGGNAAHIAFSVLYRENIWRREHVFP